MLQQKYIPSIRFPLEEINVFRSLTVVALDNILAPICEIFAPILSSSWENSKFGHVEMYSTPLL